MSTLTVIVLLVPFAWPAMVWGINRLAHPTKYPLGSRTIFVLSAASPLLALVAYALSQGSPTEAFHDPKLWAILLEIGVPASLITTAFAFWGRWLAVRS